MPKLVFLGTANAIPDEEHENTHLALAAPGCLVLVDCVGTPLVRLRKAGLDLDSLSDLILTHFHPDHVSGVPSLMMGLWLLGRKAPLNIYGLATTLERMQTVLTAYELETWPNFYPVNYVTLPAEEMTPVLENEHFRIFSSPVRHMIPAIGLRFEFSASGKSLAYSCDTGPAPEVVRLAGGVDVLVHEATGETPGHSTAAQAGGVAREAEAGALYLIHYRTGDYDRQALVDQAAAVYPGPVRLAKDFMEIVF